MSLMPPHAYEMKSDALGLVFQPGTARGAGAIAVPTPTQLAPWLRRQAVTIGCGKGCDERGRGCSRRCAKHSLGSQEAFDADTAGWPLLPNRSAFWVVAMAPAEHHHVPQTSWPIKVPVRDEQKSLGFQKSPLKEPDSVRHTLFPFHLSYFLYPGTRCDGWNCSGRIVIMRES